MILLAVSCKNGNVTMVKGIPGILEDCDTTVNRIEIGEIEDGSVLLYSELFSDVKYVPLEYTRNSLVGNVDKMLTTKDGGYLIFESSSKSVQLFDSIGHFKHSIGCCGHAENELYVYSSCGETEQLYKYVCPEKLQF